MYSFMDEVRYSEVDKNGKLSIPAAVNFLQDCCTKQSEDLGLGLKHLQEVKKIWVLNYWQIDFLQQISLGDVLEIGTWAYDAKGIYGYRNFLIQSEDKNHRKIPLVKADSLWVLLNTETGKPERVTDEDVAPYGREDKLDMESLGRKIKIQGEGEEQSPFSVRRYHIDTNGHVNNCWYIQFAMEYLPEIFYDGSIYVNRLRVEYKSSALYGDIIYPTVYKGEGNIVVSLNNKDKNPYAVVQLDF